MKPKSKTRRARRAAKGTLKDLEPKRDPRGGQDLESSPISDGSVIDKARFPGAARLPLNK